jgi:chemotaxis protein methyltransferase CheR
MNNMQETLVSVSDEEINSFTQSILIRYGIDFTCYEPKSLRRRIIRVLNIYNLHSIHELWVKFLSNKNFIHAFMNEISVSMTSMFRDPIFWSHLKTTLWQQYAGRNEINIWHAGCSTGEEVYSLAILLKELGLLERVKTLATDINLEAMDAAQKGVYHKIKMIENERNFLGYNNRGKLSHYYANNGTTASMSLELIKHVQFKYHNLITDPFEQNFDIVLCRNVMIYFDADAKGKLLQKFYHALKPGGLFIIGFYDTMLSLMDQNLFRMEVEEAKIFKKGCLSSN